MNLRSLSAIVSLPALVACCLLLASATAARAGVDVDLSRWFAPFDACFVMTRLDGTPVLRYQPERCAVRRAPCSTFKIPNSLIGLETGVIADAGYVMKWDGTKRFIAEWNRDQTLASAFEVSAVWYYQELARRVGAVRMQELVDRLDYGNRDISTGIDTFWLDASLKISADEQVRFLARLMRSELPLSARSQKLVRDIMIFEKTGHGILRGKTGSAMDFATSKSTLGWYVGAVTRADGTYVFACNMTGGQEPTGRKARDIVRTMLRAFGYL